MSEPAASISPTDRAKPLLVCVIDDDDAVRQIICAALESAGFATVEARDAENGLRAIEQSNPSLILTDILMGRCDGLELIGRIRQTRPHVPILAVTGGGTFDPKDLLNLADNSGADGILAKPFRRADLLSKVNKLLGASRAA